MQTNASFGAVEAVRPVEICPALGEGLKLFSRIDDAVGDHGMAVVQVGASLAERVSQVRQRDIGVCGQVPGQPVGRGDQCFLAARRDRQHSRRQLWLMLRSGGADRSGRFGKHDMGVGPAEAERVHPDDASFAGGERPARRRNVDLQIRERNVAGRSLKVQIGRDVPVLGDQRRLDESGHAGAGLEVADVGLDRSDEKGLRRRSIQRQCTRECPHFDGVADGSSGAVRFDVTDLGRVDARTSKRGRDRGFLSFLARHRDAVGVAVLRHRCPEDLGVDLVAFVERPLQAV